MRLEQIARGAHAYVDTTGITNIRDIVLKELEERKIPFMLGRTLPNGKKEYYRLEDMIL
jgi:DNA-directed RNA polymerase subunit K/omega